MTGSTGWWILSFLLFPYGPFLYLARLKVITWWFAGFSIFLTVVVSIGTATVLGRTNEEPWQQWVVLLLGVGFYLLGMLQYSCGCRKGIWSPRALRLWRLMGWIWGVMLLINWLSQILLFHVQDVGGFLS